jgi:hypothetical protein
MFFSNVNKKNIQNNRNRYSSVYVMNMNIQPNIFQTLVDDMKLYPKTVIEGTRNEMEYFGKEL